MHYFQSRYFKICVFRYSVYGFRISPNCVMMLGLEFRNKGVFTNDACILLPEM